MQNPRGKRSSKWSNPVHFERILVQIARVWARLSSFSSNPGANVTKKDHFDRTATRVSSSAWSTRPDFALDLKRVLADAFTTRQSFTGGLVPPPVSFPAEDRPR